MFIILFVDVVEPCNEDEPWSRDSCHQQIYS